MANLIGRGMANLIGRRGRGRKLATGASIYFENTLGEGVSRCN